jgi:hypothetical protein
LNTPSAWVAHIRIWELADGRCIRILEGHTDAVRSLSLTPDGRWLLSGSADETLSLWELDWEYEVPATTEWDGGARVYLEQFLRRLQQRNPAAPVRWDPPALQGLLVELQNRGYGWLNPDRIRFTLEQMTEEARNVDAP